MRCVKDTLIVNEKPFDQKRIAKLVKAVLNERIYGFAEVDIEGPDSLVK